MSSSVHKATPRLPGGRLAFERAIRYSSLPAPARHLALTMATWADIESGLIPDRFQPAQSTLEEATGLSRGAVFKHSKLLEAEGWLIREGGGGRSKRTKHVLRIPPGAPTSRAEKVSPGDRYRENVSPGELETCHVTPETSHVVNENLSPGDTKSSCSSDESLGSTSPSPAGPVETESPVVPDVTDGGGGGSDLRSIAEHITDSLNCLGQVPDKQQRKKLTTALLAVLQAGWTMDGLALYLYLGNYRPDNPVAFYLSKLTTKLPDTAPEPDTAPVGASVGVRGPLPTTADYEGATLESMLMGERPAVVASATWREAEARVVARLSSRPRPGTDSTVASWGDVARQLAREKHVPYSNDAWFTPADPVEAAGVPWCGELECDPRTRLRDQDAGNGLKESTVCPKCHPKMQW